MVEKSGTLKTVTIFRLIVSFIVGFFIEITLSLLTNVPGPWMEWAEEKKDGRRNAKK